MLIHKGDFKDYHGYFHFCLIFVVLLLLLLFVCLFVCLFFSGDGENVENFRFDIFLAINQDIIWKFLSILILHTCNIGIYLWKIFSMNKQTGKIWFYVPVLPNLKQFPQTNVSNLSHRLIGRILRRLWTSILSCSMTIYIGLNSIAMIYGFRCHLKNVKYPV